LVRIGIGGILAFLFLVPFSLPLVISGANSFSGLEPFLSQVFSHYFSGEAPWHFSLRRPFAQWENYFSFIPNLGLLILLKTRNLVFPSSWRLLI